MPNVAVPCSAAVPPFPDSLVKLFNHAGLVVVQVLPLSSLYPITFHATGFFVSSGA